MFEIRVDGGGSVFVSGRLSAAASDEAQRVLRSITGPTTVDCSALDYISSAGIAVLVEAYERLAGRGQPFRLVEVQPRVRAVLGTAGLEKLLGVP